ncbi:MAG: DegT/DnrJ/EryC1/StrS aminotransferase family protein, partial [Terriglobales bacterium]
MTTAAVERSLPPSAAREPLTFSPWPYFASDEIEAVTSVLRSGKVNYWTGTEGRQFEDEFAASVGTAYGVCLANGTLALELALHALGVGPGDEVITTSRSFIASATSAVLRGARPVWVDVDRDSQNITAETIRPALTPRTKAIVAVHLAGWPCDMDPILQLAAEHGIKVVEDCAQAHGASYKGRSVGSLGHLAAFSFCQDKILTTGGEGGMVTTSDAALWNRVWSYKDHGKSYDAVFRRPHPPGFRWLHDSFGTNARLTEMQSALGRVILPKLSPWVATRRQHASALSNFFRQIPALRVTDPPPAIGHSYYKYYVFLRPERLRPGWTRDRIMSEIAARGVPCFSGSCSEIYQERAFAEPMRPAHPLPVARELGETSLMFLVHPTLSAIHIERTGEVVQSVM